MNTGNKIMATDLLVEKEHLNNIRFAHNPILDSGPLGQDEILLKIDRFAFTSNNITYAAQRLNEHGITLLIEPINSKIDIPGFCIDTLDKALQAIDEVKLSNVKVQFDIYHMQIMQGDILRSLDNNLQYIQHIQFADCPGRHEPGTGELNFQNIFKHLDRIQYSGWVSAEYIPKSDTQRSLNWFQQRA